MADTADDAQVLSDLFLERSLANARQDVPVGAPGECDNCGDDSPRLVGGWCAPCRDWRAKRLR